LRYAIITPANQIEEITGASVKKNKVTFYSYCCLPIHPRGPEGRE
jgi:hypothetical protein